MKRLLLLALWAGPLAAQPSQVCKIWQPAGNQASYTCTFQNPPAVGDMLVFSGSGSIQSFSDTEQNIWTVYSGGSSFLSFASAPVATNGPETVTVTLTAPGALTGVLADYPAITGILVSPVASGSGTLATSPSLTAVAGDIVLGFGSNWTSSTMTGAVGSGFTMEVAAPNSFLEDMPATPGTVTSTASYANAANWYQGVAILHTIPPPAPLTLNLTTKLVSCVKCDRTDDSPLQGSLIFQQNGVSNIFPLAADGSISVNVNIAMTVDPVSFTVLYQNASGSQVKGGGWTWIVPRASLAAGIKTLNTFSFGGIAFTINGDGSVSFAGFLPTN
jgi:hypothetical protein